MAATGGTPIILYHSTTAAAVPSNTNLAAGELGLNIADMKLYCENDSAVVTLLASADAAAGNFTTVDTTNLEVTNIKAKDGTASATITDATGAFTISTELSVDNININGNSITSTNTDGNITLDPNGTGTIELSGPVLVSDNLVTRATLKDYAIEGSAVGNTGATRTLDFNDANFFSATLDQACTFTFSDPPASGDFGAFVLELTNGGAFAITWPASVDWPGGTAPTLTASGVDQLVFTTRDAGTTYFGFVAGLDIKSP